MLFEFKNLWELEEIGDKIYWEPIEDNYNEEKSKSKSYLIIIIIEKL